ncbi:Transcriptional regulatory protein ZraR [Bienertia sinuspersici]
MQIQLCRLRRLDDELLSKEEEIDIILKKKEAILRSKKIKAFSFNHRHSADAILDGKSQGRLRYWLEQHVVSNEVVPNKKEDIKSLPRSSFHKHRKQNSYGDQDSLHSNSPTNLPTYMAATESAKARTRSTSSPRLRPIHMDAYSDNDSPYKNKTFSPMSSINSEATCSGFSKVSNKSSFSSSNQKSPSFKGVSGPVRSNKNVK